MEIIHYKREGSILHTKSYAFAVRIVNMFLHLSNDDWRLASIYKQVLRSGTSVSANVHESEFAQSPSDFISKLSIALKEANETNYWITSLYEGGYLNNIEFVSIQADSEEIIKLLVSSIKKVKTKYGLK